MPTRAAVYLRISLDQSGEEKAVARQREDALELLRKRKWTLHEVYTDNSISASDRTKKRPEYNRMVSDYKAGLFSVIVAYDLDRLTRQPRQLEDWIDAAESGALRVVTLNGEADLATDAGRLFARVKVAVARSEIERMGARRRRANEQTVASGRPAPGRRPFGWEPDGVTLRESEAAVVREIYAVMLAGSSMRALVRDLNERGVPSPQGTPWTAFKMRQLLDRKRNMGVLERYGVEQPKSNIQPIVSADDFLKVQAMVTARSQPGRKPTKHLLSGLAVCGTCGRPLAAKALRHLRGEPRQPFYVCSSRTNRNEKSDGRTHPTIRTTMLEVVVEEAVASAFLLGPAALLPDRDSADLGDLHVKAKATADSIQRVVGLVAGGLISEGEAAAQLAPLRKEEAALAASIAEAQARSASSTFANLRAGVMLSKRPSVKAAAEAHNAIVKNYQALDFEAKRRLISALVDVTVDTGRGVGRVHIHHKLAHSLNAQSAPTEDEESEMREAAGAALPTRRSTLPGQPERN